MKQSLARITAWAKKHPWLAAGIVLGVIVLGYLVYKRSGGGGGGSDGAAFEVPEGSADVSPIPGMEGIPSPVTSGGGSSTPSSDLDISPMTGQAAPASFPEFASLPPASAGEFAAGGGWAAPDLGETVSASFAPSAVTQAVQGTQGLSAQGLGVATGGISGTPKKEPVKQASKLGVAKGTIGGKVQPKDARPARGSSTTATVTKAPMAVKKAATLAAKPGRTPAERLGLYWLYSGSYNGLRYALGYPVGVAPIGTTSGSVKTNTRRARGQ